MRTQVVSRALVYAALVTASVVVIWAFSLIGSPSFNRKVSGDQNRIYDLRQLTNEIERYFDEQKKLPEKLVDLEKLKYGYGSPRDLEDPTTKKPYEYRAIDPLSYEVCADFELTSKELEFEKNSYRYRDEKSWEHGIGRHCFKFDIQDGKSVAEGN